MDTFTEASTGPDQARAADTNLDEQGAIGGVETEGQSSGRQHGGMRN